MELFYSRDIEGGICRLDADESGHCVRVLRHRSGDEISVIDGCGTLYRCRITCDSHKGVEAAVLSAEEGWGSHPYNLHLAVCPTKNNDRYEWFAEKACEIGFDRLTPVIGDHSERRVLKTARVEKILVSAAKQSLKAAVPTVDEPVSVKEFIKMHGIPAQAGDDGVLRLIAYCFEDENVPRRSIKEALDAFEAKYGVRPQYDVKASYWNDWVQFRCDYINNFVARVRKLIDETRPGVLLGADVVPDPTKGVTHNYQNYFNWLENGWLDILFPKAA